MLQLGAVVPEKQAERRGEIVGFYFVEGYPAEFFGVAVGFRYAAYDFDEVVDYDVVVFYFVQLRLSQRC